MCIIIDANKYGEYLDEKKDELDPVRQWVKKPKSKIAYSPTSDFERELGNRRHPSKMRDYLYDLSGIGKVKMISKEEVYAKQKEIESEGALISKDSHILALAILAKAKLLVSDDWELQQDFRNIVGGRTYQSKKNKNLLKNPKLCDCP